MEKSQFRYGVPAIVIVLLILFMFYVLMVYPEERAKLLFGNKETYGGNVVYIKDGEFQPSEITINKGESVTWVNQDSTTHRINGANFMSPILPPGRSYTHIFAEKGVYVYSCEFHPEMTGKVIVK